MKTLMDAIATASATASLLLTTAAAEAATAAALAVLVAVAVAVCWCPYCDAAHVTTILTMNSISFLVFTIGMYHHTFPEDAALGASSAA